MSGEAKEMDEAKEMKEKAKGKTARNAKAPR
jgi:hypothetical protein